MNVLTDRVKTVYFKYLASAFGSTLITSIYGIVDMAMVGQYQGPDGSAAMGVFAPIWNIIYSFALLAGIGGAVLFSNIRGRGEGNERKSNEYFTASILFGVLLSAIATALVWLWNEPLLIFFGADEVLLPLAQSYLTAIKFTVPFFVLNQVLSSFICNDGNPALATASVLFGGIFNMFGDWFFVFALDMGIRGAGLATAIGAVLSFLLMLVHFFRRKNTLRIVKPTRLVRKLARIAVTGFPTCITDIAMGVMTVLFNRQIVRYLGTDALAVYAVVVNISTFVQCCAYSVGQASQPLISMNFGAGRYDRIRECLRYATYTAIGFGVFWTALSSVAPEVVVGVFMNPTQAVLEIAPAIIRTYSLSFLILPFNVFSTYYFQARMKRGTSFAISIARGCIVSGACILLLPTLLGADALWLSMPITETVILAGVICLILIEGKSESREKRDRVLVAESGAENNE